MAVVFESIGLRGIRKADLMQLLGYIEHIEEDGVYWGNKKQFIDRHNRIKELIGHAVEYAYSDGVVMPAKRKKEVGDGQ